MAPTTPADARSVDDLLSLSREADAAEYLFFWGHRKPPSGVSASCLSQWWEAPFTVDGKTYRTAEHYMMAGKARLFGDVGSERRILAAEHPGDAKALGRGVAGFEQGAWEAARYGIVVEGSVAKFGRHPELAAFLLGTGARVLVEASPGDRVWGIGMAKDDPDVGDPRCWRGLNLLGFALMEARARLR
ncbi:NADAR family protein [Nocardiopsis sp. HNM0947]|uniref:NADAR family protein n=1 Tax=Nocardiopsis coralli TaxID=2772213 RepID=A0ABR9P5R9_9ACTN|nr:NADAR family protein [Nocardiopsis coralli]MBE2999186.1 NADAR family protein [Nocardiopsis coralli]